MKEIIRAISSIISGVILIGFSIMDVDWIYKNIKLKNNGKKLDRKGASIVCCILGVLLIIYGIVRLVFR